jgi:hypothetical protein
MRAFSPSRGLGESECDRGYYYSGGRPVHLGSGYLVSDPGYCAHYTRIAGVACSGYGPQPTGHGVGSRTPRSSHGGAGTAEPSLSVKAGLRRSGCSPSRRFWGYIGGIYFRTRLPWPAAFLKKSHAPCSMRMEPEYVGASGIGPGEQNEGGGVGRRRVPPARIPR